MVALSLAISGVTLIALSTLLYQGIKDSQQAAFDSSLYNHAVDIANATDLTVLGQLIVKREALIDERKIFPFPLGQSIVQIRGIDGSTILSSRPLNFIKLPWSRKLANELLERGAMFETFGENGNLRIVHFLIQKPPLPPLILQVAVPLTMVRIERAQILSLLFTLIPIALLAAGASGFVIARRALAPMNRIIKTAHSIQAKELSARVPVPEETELRELAVTLNDLLTRLQKAFESQEKFIADASHQLKTPLAIIRGEIDVYRRSIEQSKGSAPEPLIDSVSQEVKQLSGLVDDLLLLARFDSGVLQPEFKKIRIDEILMEAVAQVSKVAREKNVEIRMDFTQGDTDGQTEGDMSDLEVNGDEDLLKVLFFNILENAIKYSPANSSLQVRLSSDQGTVKAEIKDQGPGIPKNELPRIFDRFFRGSRTQLNSPGVGLGLSIAQRIARLHLSELTAESELGQGSKFVLRIKKV